MPAFLRLKDRVLPVLRHTMCLVVRGRPPLSLLHVDFRLEADDGDWEANVKTASWVPFPVAPFVEAGAIEEAVPLKDLAGTSFNLSLYVFEHAPVREAVLQLRPAGLYRTHLRLTGRADVGWNETYGRDLELEAQAELAVEEVLLLGATDEASARVILDAVGLPVPEGAVFVERYGTIRLVLPPACRG